MPDAFRARLQTSLGTAYTLERELRGGGMSRVFVARETRFGRDVVVKVLAPELAQGLSGERFEREIALAAGLQQANVVPVLTAGDVDGLPWYTMPYVEGESLRVRMDRGPVPSGEAVSVLRDVARALAYAHGRGIVHRDIKPENVLISGGAAVVTDFGIAKAVSASKTRAPGDGLTQLGTSLGTPAYMAPEQAAGDDVDHRADLYAWGVVAYELLAGRHPFAGRTTAQQLIAAHIAEAPGPLGTTAPHVPSPLAALVTRTLEKDPARRPADSAELLAALDDTRATAQGAGRAFPRRAAIATVAVLLLLALIGGAMAWRARGSPARTDARLVAVLPFRVAGADPALHYLREGMLDLLAAKLTGSTRVVEPRAALAAWRAAGGAETTDVDQQAAVTLGARLGAGEVLLGDVTNGDAGRVVLRATLVPTAGGAPREATVEGSRDSVSSLVDRLAIELLALRAGQDLQALGSLRGTPLPAVRDFLEGQSLMRRGRYAKALPRFVSAVRTDSNFAPAWVGVHGAAAWLRRDAIADTAAGQIVRLRDRLPRATRALMDAVIGPRYPAQPSAAALRRLAEEATRVAPDSPDAWVRLGELHYHYGAAMGVDDAVDRGIGAFERALTLDSSMTEPLEHLPDLYRERGDTAAMRRSLEAMLERDSTAQRTLFLADVLLGDARRGAQWRAMARQQRGIGLGDLALLAASLGVSPRAVDSALVDALPRRVTDAEQRGTGGALYLVALLQGQPARAARVTRRLPPPTTAAASTVAVDRVIVVLVADGDSALAAESRAALDGALAVDPSPPNVGAWFVAALYDLGLGRPETARRAVARLRAASPGCGARAPTLCADYARVLDAQLASADRRPDARARLVEMDSMLREVPVRSGVLLWAGNLLAARLWEREGDRARALAAVRRRVRYFNPDPAVATFLREEGRLAAATGDVAGAVRAYRHYLALREDAEPPFRAHLDGVRRELARLERLQTGR